MIAERYRAGGADTVTPHGKELKISAVVATGAESGCAGLFGKPYGCFEFVPGAGFATAEMIGGHGIDVGFDVLLSDCGESRGLASEPGCGLGGAGSPFAGFWAVACRMVSRRMSKPGMERWWFWFML
jgi:hypothetical protein